MMKKNVVIHLYNLVSDTVSSLRSYLSMQQRAGPCPWQSLHICTMFWPIGTARLHSTHLALVAVKHR